VDDSSANAASMSGVPQAPAERQGPQQQTRAQLEVDDSQALACYANFCRVTGTPEELLIDFGVSSQFVGGPPEPVVVSQRVVTNLYTAKRLIRVLQLTIERHEAAFGALETDIQKRVRIA